MASQVSPEQPEMKLLASVVVVAAVEVVAYVVVVEEVAGFVELVP